jgi:hypothetical protein
MNFPFIGAASGVEGVLIPGGIPGYKISLRGLQVTVQSAPVVSGPATLALSQLATVDNKQGRGPNGSFVLTFLPSTTKALYFSYEFPEGCVETIGFPVEDIQGPPGQPYSITWAVTPSGTDDLNVDLAYWGQFVPISG